MHKFLRQFMVSGIAAPEVVKTVSTSTNGDCLPADCSNPGGSNCDTFGDCDCKSDCDCKTDCACTGD